MSLITTYHDSLDCFYALASTGPERLGAVYEKVTQNCRVTLALRLTTKMLCFTADANHDTIRGRLENARCLDTTWRRLDAKKPWSALIGAAFGWGWITINQQGYCDGVLLSFNGHLPTLLLSVVGSSITIRRLVEEDESITPSKR
jgi:hypothetical protein